MGTYLLMFVGFAAIVVNKEMDNVLTPPGVAVLWGLDVMVMIYTVGHVSGAHFNPAVTIAFATCKRFAWKQVVPYILVQVVASTLASGTVQMMFGAEGEEDIFVGTLPSGSNTQSLVLEFIITFYLMFAVSGVSTDDLAIGELGGLALGALVTMNSLFAGPISGASMNPARSLGPAIVSNYYKGGMSFEDWKIRMEIFLAAYNDNMYRCITQGPIKVTKKVIVDGVEKVVEKDVEEMTPDEIKLNNLDKVGIFIMTKALDNERFDKTAKPISPEIEKKEMKTPKAKKGKKPENEKQTGKTKQQSSPKKSADKSKTNQTSTAKSSVKEQVKSKPKKQRNYNKNAWYGNESHYVQPAYSPYYAAPHYPPYYAAYPAHQPMHAYPAYHASYPAYEHYSHHNDYQHNMPTDYDETEVAHAPAKTLKPKKPKTSTSWVIKGDTNLPGPSQ
ncbi:hypothetical protein RD792_005768 [Penstemon davidsonii]|uniref:Uncharacterized protein n=1 Tax=Penstemon davidsonii TaxID=160366 RepID=A0ABR0DFG2_9LAMI|nr:hypothetical protein RD792_005768 [Penstemon davidsonii]